MTEAATVDRFEGDQAVLLVGEKQSEMVVAKCALPMQVKEGTRLKVEVVNGQLLSAVIDAQATEAARKQIGDKLAALRRGEHLK